MKWLLEQMLQEGYYIHIDNKTNYMLQSLAVITYICL